MGLEHGRLRVLQALRARLELDSGLGCEYSNCGEAVLTAVKQAAVHLDQEGESPSSTPAARPVSAPPPHRISALAQDRPAAPSVPPAAVRTAAPAVPPSRALPEGYVSLVPYQEPPHNPGKEALLADLQAECLSCTACALSERRTRVAWGEGDLDAKVMFIGEGPGRDEDREGRPFVGRSGRLLTDIIEKGMKVPRTGVYIANVVKCRPPGNRDPKSEEVAACSRYLGRQIEVISPKIIVAVGGVAGCALLGLPPRTPGLRNKWHEFQGIPMRVIFHPSYLLRQRRSDNDRTKADRDTWNDIQEVMARLDGR